MHESTGMGMGWGMEKFHGNGGDFHYTVSLFSTVTLARNDFTVRRQRNILLKQCR